MDAYVYTAQAVVDAAAGVVPVKRDGDIQRELVKKYAVEAYPTLILLDAEGKELRRAVGYQSVKQMTAFFTVPEPKEDA
jgi:thioredoxin-related protein